jgi:hypothetical protein
MTPLLCRIGFHDLAGLVSVQGSDVFGSRRCLRCHQAIGGVRIERPAPKATPPAKAKPNTPTWLRAVYETKRA